MKEKIVIGTRNSKLALWQTNYVAEQLRKTYPRLQIEIVEIMTKGDKILDVPLAKIGGKGLFTKELEVDLISGKIDLAVHSLKDMPTQLPEGLALGAVTKRLHSGDAFVSNKYASLEELPQGAVVGTSSLRRKAQLLHHRPDLQIKDLRGNVQTRLAKLDQGDYDAIVLAVAGLKRLGYEQRILEVLPQSVCLPAVGQGALAIEVRAEDEDVKELLKFLDDEDTRIATTAERAFLALLEGGCQVPVGVYAEVKGNELKAEGIIASLDGSELYRDAKRGALAEAAEIGRALAQELLDKGGLKILQSIGLCTEMN